MAVGTSSLMLEITKRLNTKSMMSGSIGRKPYQAGAPLLSRSFCLATVSSISLAFSPSLASKYFWEK